MTPLYSGCCFYGNPEISVFVSSLGPRIRTLFPSAKSDAFRRRCHCCCPIFELWLQTWAGELEFHRRNVFSNNLKYSVGNKDVPQKIFESLYQMFFSVKELGCVLLRWAHVCPTPTRGHTSFHPRIAAAWCQREKGEKTSPPGEERKSKTKIEVVVTTTTKRKKKDFFTLRWRRGEKEISVIWESDGTKND